MLLLLATACAHQLPHSPSSDQLHRLLARHPFGPRPSLPSSEAVHQLSREQRSDFLRYLNHPSRILKPPHRRVAEYLEEFIASFEYQGRTGAAHTTLADRAGNCMSLAVLTTALADAAGVDIGYELIDSAPVFEWFGTLVFRGLHVRTVLRAPAWVRPDGMPRLLSRTIRIDYFPQAGDRLVRKISRGEYLALYYANLAAEEIRQDRLDMAYWLLRSSLAADPQNANAWNSMAVVFRRAGRLPSAEAIYLFGIEALSEKPTFLRNYRSLLVTEGRREEVAAVERMLYAYEEDFNPVDWLAEGERAFRDGHYRTSIRYYRKALKLAPYLHAAYVGVARAYYRLDDKAQAAQELKAAIGLASRPSDRTRYEAKLNALLGATDAE